MSIIDAVMPRIAYAGPLVGVFNPWLDSRPDDIENGPEHRRARLAAHFECVPKILLIGEAPGYQGCAVSGVPFTSEAQICRGDIPRVVSKRITTRERPYSEPSATIMWGILRELGVAEHAVMWNAYPWHPHVPDQPATNRTPTEAECRAGRAILIDIARACINANAAVRIVAVGRKAEKSVDAIVPRGSLRSVRHPSMGGANDFREGLRAVLLQQSAAA